jgi:hypothetical protein
MWKHRVPKQRPILGSRQFAFQTDPADYTEIGKQYRQKSIQAEIALLAYAPTFFIAVFIAYWV